MRSSGEGDLLEHKMFVFEFRFDGSRSLRG